MRRRKEETTEDQNLFIGRLNKAIRFNEDTDYMKHMVRLLKECRAAIWTQQNMIDVLQAEVKDLNKERQEFLSIFKALNNKSASILAGEHDEHFGNRAAKRDHDQIKCSEPKGTMS